MRNVLVFIKCELGKTYEVAAEIVETDLCPTVYSVSGEYDLFALVRFDDDADIGREICEGLQKIDGIKETSTTICFNPFTRDSGLKNK